MNKTIRKVLLIVAIIGLAGLSSAAAPPGYQYNPKCDLGFDWTSSNPKGVTNGTNGECPFGLEYPSFNAFRNSQYIKQGDRANQFEFAWVRKNNSNPNFYNNTKLYGYTNNVRLKEDEVARSYFYVHNAGRPDCNFSNNSSKLRENGCIRSTIAKNAQIKLNGLTEDGQYLVSNGVLSGSTRIHNLSATISSSNATPRNLSDGFSITTDSDKILRVPKNTPVTVIYCQNLGPIQASGKRDCKQTGRLESITMENFHNGINLNNIYSGSNESGFFASEGYVLDIFAFFAQSDAPDEEILCERLITSPAQTSDKTTQTFKVTFSPNEQEFHQNIRVSGISSNNFQISPNKTFGRTTSTDITLSNLSKGSQVTISSAGSPNCKTTLTFPRIPGPQCTDLNLIRDAGKGTDTQQFFTVNTTPNSFLEQARPTLQGAGTLTGTVQTELVVSNFDENTTLQVGVPGQSACQAEVPFDQFVKKPVCELLTINIPDYDYRVNPRPTFEITATPTDFKDNYIWEVKNEDGSTIETSRGEATSFRPNTALDGTQTVHVRAENALPEENCETSSKSAVPPVTEICEDIRVIRTLQRQLGRTVPTDGSPAIFTFDTGKFDGEITLQTTGDPSGTVFLTKDSRAEGEITISPDETIIILNTNEAGRIRIFAQEQNQYTKDCFTELIPDPKDPGDPLTELDKSVDKAFATDGEILTYTIRYTISPIFDNPEFRDLLEEIVDTAEIRDNVNQISGIQDRAVNPLTSPDSRIIVTDVFLPRGLEDATGDLFGPEGLVIPNLAEKAGNTYTIKYTAILRADIIEECKIITDSCGFVFPNTAFDNFGNEDTAAVLATCPFVVSRSFGNVFLEEGFENTIDIAQCTDTRSSEGPVFTPREQKPQELIKSGGTGIFSRPSHRICQESVKANPSSTILGDELEGYRNPLENFSSSVCEVSLFTGNNWTSDDIERSMRSNASRFQNNTNLNSTSELLSLNEESLVTFDAQNPNPKSKVYRKTNGNLTIGNGSDIIISDGTAKTIIVEGNDLIINSNITYGQNQNPLFPSQIAFIVIGGDIQVGPNVTDLSGIITAVPDENGNGGIIKRSQNTDKLLTVTGSMFGDSGPLFAGTSNPGNLTQIKGAVTVIYDGNIILNTPPALEDIVKFSQYQTVR